MNKSSYHIKQIRVGLILGNLIYLFFGAVSSYFGFSHFDNFFVRLPISIGILLFTYLTFISRYLERKIDIVFLISGLTILLQYYPFFLKSNYHFYYAMGLMVIHFFIVSLMLNIRDILIFSILNIITCLYFTREINAIFITMLTLTMAISIFTYFLLIRMRNNLILGMEQKELRLKKLNNAATQAAHDIRSPVQALKVLSERLVADESARKIIYDSVSRIQYISETLLSEYKDINKESNSKSVNLYNVVTSAIDEKKSLYKNHDIMLDSKHKEGCIPSAWSHEIYRVISNILQNAIDASSETQKISVRLFEESDMITISIQDNGSGISKDHLDKVFDYGFTHGKTNGTGLGLAHAKECIEKIGGQLSISSKEGKGTLVTIKLRVN